MTAQPTASPDDGAAPDPIARQLETLDTGVVSDAMDSLSLHGSLSGIHPMWSCGRVAGPVRTMLLRPVSPDAPAPPSRTHLGCRVIELSQPGDVVVVAHQGRVDSGGWGGLLSVAAHVRGIRAVVVDGASRDIEEAEQAGLPLFARAGTPVSARGRTVEVEVDQPVDLAGLRVRPGDYLLADRTGVLVIDQDRVGEVLARALQMQGAEERMREAIIGGTPVSQVMDRRYESMTDPASALGAPSGPA
jgi:4-hydroxy-4-methyl-2-oxoglutarate aldolase